MRLQQPAPDHAHAAEIDVAAQGFGEVELEVRDAALHVVRKPSVEVDATVRAAGLRIGGREAEPWRPSRLAPQRRQIPAISSFRLSIPERTGLPLQKRRFRSVLIMGRRQAECRAQGDAAASPAGATHSAGTSPVDRARTGGASRESLPRHSGESARRPALARRAAAHATVSSAFCSTRFPRSSAI